MHKLSIISIVILKLKIDKCASKPWAVPVGLVYMDMLLLFELQAIAQNHAMYTTILILNDS